MYFSAVTGSRCSQEHLGLLQAVVELGNGVILISLLGSAQTVPRAGFCSVLGALRERKWLYGRRA